MDEITFTLAEEAKDAPTATAILGPFFRADTPYRENGADIVVTKPKDGGEMAFMHGQVIDFETKKPLVGADVEVWQASTNGLYEQQDPEQVEFNLRGKFKTDSEGRYNFYCLRPTPYPVPDDGEKIPFFKLEIDTNTGIWYRPRWQAAESYGSPSLPPCSHSHHCQFLPVCLEVVLKLIYPHRLPKTVIAL